MKIFEAASRAAASFLARLGPRPPVQERKVYNPTATSEFFLPPRLRGSSFDDPYRQSSWMYAAIEAAADEIMQLPFLIKRGTRETSVIVRGHPLNTLFEKPCPLLTGPQFWQVTTIHLQRDGRCVWVKEGKSDAPIAYNEVPSELWPLSGKVMFPVLDAKTRTMILEWAYVPPAGTVLFYKPWQVVDHKYVDPDDLSAALPPIAAAEMAARADFKAAMWDEVFLDNDATPGGILVSTGRLTDKQRRDIKDAWESRHQGVGKNSRVALLEGGLTWTQNTVDHSKMQFSEKRKFSREEIAAVTKTPLSILMNYEGMTYASSRSADYNYIERKINPLMRLLEDSAKVGLFLPIESGQYFGEFDRTALAVLDEALSAKLDNAKKMLEMGVPINQIIKTLGLGWKPLPPEIGDVSFLAQNLVRAEDVVDPPEPPPQLAAPGAPPEEAPGLPAAVGEGEDDGRASEDAALDEAAALEVQERVPRSAVESAVQRLLVRQPRRLQDLWRTLLRTHFAPLQVKFRSKVRKWVREVRAEQLALLEQLTLPERAARLSWAQLRANGGTPLFDLDKATKRLQKIVDPVYRETVRGAIEATFQELGGNWSDLSSVDEKLLDIVEQRKAVLASAPAALQKRLARTIESAVREGTTVGELAGRIRADFNGFSGHRSMTIARTEVANATNQARNAAFLEEGIEKHQWVTAGDEAVRPTHADQDGQVVKVGEPFDNGLLYPGDPAGEPGEVINCRCIVVAADTGGRTAQLRWQEPARLETRFDPNQPRDDDGKWAPGGVGGASGKAFEAIKQPKPKEQEDFYDSQFELPKWKVMRGGDPLSKDLKGMDAKQLKDFQTSVGERRGLQRYVEEGFKGGSKNQGSVLRARDRDISQRTHIEALDRMKFKQEIKLYRGMRLPEDVAMKIKPGSNFDFGKSIQSFSESQSVAKSFASGYHGNKAAVIVQVKLPTRRAIGSYRVFKKAFSEFPEEKEWVFNRLKKLKVISVKSQYHPNGSRLFVKLDASKLKKGK